MIDIHSHIIPGADDGSKSIEATFEMLKEAQKAGFTDIISTSHYIEGHYEMNKIDRQAWITALNTGIKQKNIDINISTGDIEMNQAIAKEKINIVAIIFLFPSLSYLIFPFLSVLTTRRISASSFFITFNNSPLWLNSYSSSIIPLGSILPIGLLLQ